MKTTASIVLLAACVVAAASAQNATFLPHTYTFVLNPGFGKFYTKEFLDFYVTGRTHDQIVLVSSKLEKEVYTADVKEETGFGFAVTSCIVTQGLRKTIRDACYMGKIMEGSTLYCDLTTGTDYTTDCTGYIRTRNTYAIKLTSSSLSSEQRNEIDKAFIFASWNVTNIDYTYFEGDTYYASAGELVKGELGKGVRDIIEDEPLLEEYFALVTDEYDKTYYSAPGYSQSGKGSNSNSDAASSLTPVGFVLTLFFAVVACAFSK